MHSPLTQGISIRLYDMLDAYAGQEDGVQAARYWLRKRLDAAKGPQAVKEDNDDMPIHMHNSTTGGLAGDLQPRSGKWHWGLSLT